MTLGTLIYTTFFLHPATATPTGVAKKTGSITPSIGGNATVALVQAQVAEKKTGSITPLHRGDAALTPV